MLRLVATRGLRPIQPRGKHALSVRANVIALHKRAYGSAAAAAEDGKENADLRTLPMSVFYGSQSGTAQMLAHLFAQEAEQQGIQAEVVDLDEFNGEELTKEQTAVFVMATFGEGEVTDNAKKFYDWLTNPARTNDDVKGAKYFLFGLGNSRAYADRYQKASKDVEERLVELGCHLELPRGEGDDAGEVEDDFDNWKDRVWAKLNGEEVSSAEAEGSGGTKKAADIDNMGPVPEIPINMHDGAGYDWRASDSLDLPVPPVVDHKNPVPVRVMQNRELCNTANTGRSARHVELDITGRLNYTTGDHVGIFPMNEPELVERFCERMGYDLNAAFSFPDHAVCQGRKALCDRIMTVREALMRQLDLQAAPGRVTVETLARLANDPAERQELFEMSRPENKDLMKAKVGEEYIGIAELCLRYPSIRVPLSNTMEILPRIQSRFYSISSSSSIYPDSIHMSVSVLDARLKAGGRFKGLCSNFIKRLSPGKENVRVFVRQSLFRMPPDPSNHPMIMIAAGAGLAPLRAFLQERQYLKDQGATLAPAHLYFGVTHPDQDLIYGDELNGYVKSGVLDVFQPAYFEVPGANGEVFVQHYMSQPARMGELSKLLAAGGRIYVCGRANTVGVGVDEALTNILTRYPVPGMGSMSPKEYLLAMRHDYRYNLDVFAE